MTTRFDDALVYAHRVHRDQRRKGTGIPYVAHVLGVASLVLEHGATEAEAIGALLHDAAEDGGGEARLAEIRARFGDEVAEIVLGCSDSLAEHPEDKAPWIERKRAALAHVETASASVCLVSAADKLHNVRAIGRDLETYGAEVWDRFDGRRDGTLWYYREMADTLAHRYRTAITRDLQRAVDDLLAAAESIR